MWVHPLILKDANPRDTLLGMIENITDKAAKTLPQVFRKRSASADVLCAAAISSADQVSDAAEMDKLIICLIYLSALTRPD